jgi:hypothetical protein
MRAASALAAGALAAALGSSAAAATCHYSRDYEGEERSWVGWSPNKVGYRDDDGVDKSSLMFLSAQISLTLPVGVVCGTPQHGELLAQVLPSMRLMFTQIAEHSAAVQPPSFNPRILRLGFRYRWWPGAQAFINPDGKERAVGLILNVWSHHSDGQYGPTYYDRAGNGTDDLAAAVQANRENGDFGTNYLGAKAWARVSRLDDNGNRPRQGLFASAEYQFHHGAVFPGGLDDKLRPIWGRHHLLLSAEYRTGYTHDPKGDVAPSDDLGGAYCLVAADGWWVADAGSSPVVTSHSWRAALEAAWFVPKYLGPSGVFVRGDVGRNPLNIRFVENRNEILFGIMVDTSQVIERLSPP